MRKVKVMTRYKKEVRKAGFKLNNDYPYLPYKNLENVYCGVRINGEEKCIILYQDFVFGTEIIKIDRAFDITIDFD